MYVRPPESPKVKLPENYRGNAFGASGEYTDMPPPTRIPTRVYDLPPEDIPPEDTPPDPPKHISAPQNIDKEMTVAQAVKSEITAQDIKEVKSSSIFSTLAPPSSTSSRFPFGHGIGTEELLIMGMMLLVFMHGDESGEIDNELILLLALLLFSG